MRCFTRFIALLFLFVSFVLPGSNASIKVNSDRLSLRQGPGTHHPILSRLPMGVQLNLLEDLGEWVKVGGRLNGKEIQGYLFHSFIEFLPPSATWRNARIVADPSAHLRFAPNLESKILLTLPKGNEIMAQESDNTEFFRVCAEDSGNRWSGYIFHSLIQVEALLTPPAPPPKAEEAQGPVTQASPPVPPPPPAPPAKIPAPDLPDKTTQPADTLPAINPEASKRFSLSYLNGFFFPRSKPFEVLYGSARFLPRFEISYRIGGRLSVSAAYSWINASGSSPLTERKIDSRQSFASLGLSYTLWKKKTYQFNLSASPAILFFKEQIGSQSNDGSALGFDTNAELCWQFYPAFGGLFKIGYNSASHESDSIKTELGGFWLGLGIRASF